MADQTLVLGEYQWILIVRAVVSSGHYFCWLPRRPRRRHCLLDLQADKRPLCCLASSALPACRSSTLTRVALAPQVGAIAAFIFGYGASHATTQRADIFSFFTGARLKLSTQSKDNRDSRRCYLYDTHAHVLRGPLAFQRAQAPVATMWLTRSALPSARRRSRSPRRRSSPSFLSSLEPWCASFIRRCLLPPTSHHQPSSRHRAAAAAAPPADGHHSSVRAVAPACCCS